MGVQSSIWVWLTGVTNRFLSFLHGVDRLGLLRDIRGTFAALQLELIQFRHCLHVVWLVEGSH